MAWNQSEWDWLSQMTGMTITPDMYQNIGYEQDRNTIIGGETQGDMYRMAPDEMRWWSGGQLVDPTTGEIIVPIPEDNYNVALGGIKDQTKVKFDPYVGAYTPLNNIDINKSGMREFVDKVAPWAIMGAGAAIMGPGLLAEMGIGGGAAPGSLAATHPAAYMTASQELAAAGMSTSEIAAVLGTPAVAASVAGGSTIGAALAIPGVQTALKIAAPAVLSKLIGGGGGSGGGGSGGGIGDMLTSGANMYYQNELGKQAVSKAEELAKGIGFTPYSISSGMGRSYIDPATGEMVSELAPEWQGAQDELMNSFYGNMQYATMDPMEASQYAYNMGSNLNAYQDEQNRLGLENRLLNQGMLGSTGGASQMRALYDANNQRDLGREAQSLQLGQGMVDSYQRRGLAAYQPAWNTQTQFANQIGQSGQLGGQRTAADTNSANMINNAYLGRMGMLSQGATSLSQNPALNNGLNNIIGSGINAIGNYFQPGYEQLDYNTANNAYDNTYTSGNFDTNASDYYTWDY